MKYKLMLAITQLDTLATNTQADLSKTVMIVAPCMAVAGLLIATVPPLKKVGLSVVVCSVISIVGVALIEIGLFDTIRGLVG